MCLEPFCFLYGAAKMQFSPPQSLHRWREESVNFASSVGACYWVEEVGAMGTPLDLCLQRTPQMKRHGRRGSRNRVGELARKGGLMRVVGERALWETLRQERACWIQDADKDFSVARVGWNKKSPRMSWAKTTAGSPVCYLHYHA